MVSPKKRPAGRLIKFFCCLAACLLAAVLFCGWQTRQSAGQEGQPPAEPGPSAPAAIDLSRPDGGQLDLAALTGQQNGPPAPAPAGDAMTEAELLDTARDLLARGQALYDWFWFPGGWALDAAAPLEEEWNGAPRLLYPLLDLADEAQLRAVYTSIFSEDALRREEARQRELAEVYPGTEYGRFPFVTREGRLYADPAAFFSLNSTRIAPDTLRLVGVSADAAVLEARLLFWDGTPSEQGRSITLLRENGRWVLAGPLWDMPLDNHFVPLPDELAALAADWDKRVPEAAFCLRQAARLGQALAAGDAEEVNRCFIDNGGEAPIYDWPISEMRGYAFADLTGLQITGWRVEPAEPLPQGDGAPADGALAPLPDIWLCLDVADPGATPLRAGQTRYLLGFHTGGDSTFARGCVADLRPESEAAAVDKALESEAYRQTTLLRWFLGRDAFDDLANEEPERLLCYCAVRLRWEGLIGEDGGASEERLAAAPNELLGLEGIRFDTALLVQEDHSFRDGLWYPPGRDGFGGSGPEGRSRFAALAREGDTVTAVLRFYQDAQCLVPGRDLVYTFHISPAGVWQPVRCEQQIA